jgi:hypothetical protein
MAIDCVLCLPLKLTNLRQALPNLETPSGNTTQIIEMLVIQEPDVIDSSIKGQWKRNRKINSGTDSSMWMYAVLDESSIIRSVKCRWH